MGGCPSARRSWLNEPERRIRPAIVYMRESQFHYVLAALRAARERSLQRLEVRAPYNEDLPRRLKKTVWNSGTCTSRYRDDGGDNPIMWSDYTLPLPDAWQDFELDGHTYTLPLTLARQHRPGSEHHYTSHRT
jgi:hypothetical protein